MQHEGIIVRQEIDRAPTESLQPFTWRTDANGETIECDQGWYEYTGQTAEEARGTGWMYAIHREDLERVVKMMLEAGQNQHLYEVEYRLRRASDRSYRWFLARATPIRDEIGCITAWVGSSTDIEELKHAR